MARLVKENKTKDKNTLVLDNVYKVNENVLQKGTKLVIKESKQSEDDIVVTKSTKVNDHILVKGDVISLVVEKNRPKKQRRKVKEGAGGGFTLKVENISIPSAFESSDDLLRDLKAIRYIVSEGDVLLDNNFGEFEEDEVPLGSLVKIDWNLDDFLKDIGRYDLEVYDEYNYFSGEVVNFSFGQDPASDGWGDLYHVGSTLKAGIPSEFKVYIMVEVAFQYKDSDNGDTFILEGKATFKPSNELIDFVDNSQNSDDFY